MSGDDNVGHAASTADHWTLSVDRAEKPVTQHEQRWQLQWQRKPIHYVTGKMSNSQMA